MLDLATLRARGILGLDADTFEALIAECERLRDFPARWASLTDSECAAALRAAPRVAGEWERVGWTEEIAIVQDNWVRVQVGRSSIAADVCRSRIDGEEYWIGVRVDGGYCEGPDPFPTLDLARAACDAALVAAGWRGIG